MEGLVWRRLIHPENVGPITFYRPMERFGSTAAGLEALPTLARRGSRGKIIQGVPKSECRARDDLGAGSPHIEHHIVAALGQAGMAVVSGLARGIDAAAHEATLATGEQSTLVSGMAPGTVPQAQSKDIGPGAEHLRD